MKRILCITIIALFFVPVIGNSKSNEWHTSPEILDQNIPVYEPVNAPLNLDEPDQSQTNSNNGYKIYNNHWAAQSFKPSKEKITKIQILVNRTEKKSFEFHGSIFHLFFNFIRQ